MKDLKQDTAREGNHSESEKKELKQERDKCNNIQNLASLFPVINTKNLQQSRSALLRSPFRFLSNPSKSPLKRSPGFFPTTPENPTQIGPDVLKVLKKYKTSLHEGSKFISPKIEVHRNRRINSSSGSPADLNWTPESSSPARLSLASPTSDECSDTLSRSGEEDFETQVNGIACRYKSTIGNRTFLVSSPRSLSPEKKKSVSILSQLLSAQSAKTGEKGECRAIKKLQQVKLLKKADTGAVANRPLGEQAASDSPDKKSVSRAIPLDWTLKKEITFLCNKPFNTVEQSKFGPASFKSPRKRTPRKHAPVDLPGYHSYSEFGSNNISSSLIRWIYPSNDFPPLYSSYLPQILEKKTSEQPILEHELKDLQHYNLSLLHWKEAFESLYESLDSQTTKSFYYISCKYTVLFLSSSVVNIPGVRRQKSRFDTLAIISLASPGEQKKLQSEGIAFSAIPSKTKTITEPSSPFVNDDTSPRSPPSDLAPATVVIIDQSSVHKLYKYLIVAASEYTLHIPFTLPTLLSDNMFLNASFQKAKIVKNDKIRYDIQDPINSNKLETMHKLQIKGTLLPLCLNSLLKSIRLEQARLFDSDKDMMLTVTFMLDEKTLGLNEGYMFAKSLLSEKSLQKAPDNSVATLRALLCKKSLVMWK